VVVSTSQLSRIVAGALGASGGLIAVKAHPGFGPVSAFVGGGLVFAGVTGTWVMARRPATLPTPCECDLEVMIEALNKGERSVSS
jgi:hypothetical protein